eukprot:gb/GFBE01020490.1/.p1 GENE.gb/GFBE01020490.1/~~gb/GFBE01020490.1/.p1  ORF type:complete len:125 (+),score=31.66 gb/GFBE01020490.1/:1-375(+)
MARFPMRSAALLALAACVALKALGSAFVAPPAGRPAVSSQPAIQLQLTPAAAPADEIVAVRPSTLPKAVEVAALNSAFAMMAEPAWAGSLDDRQDQANLILIGTVIAAVVITAGFVVVLGKMYE